MVENVMVCPIHRLFAHVPDICFSSDYLFVPEVLGVLAAFLDIVGILEGLDSPLRDGPPAALLSDVSEQADCVSRRSKSEASLPLRLLARLPVRLPARLPLFLGSGRLDLAPEGVVPDMSPVREERLVWIAAFFILLLCAGVTSHDGIW